MNGTPLQLTLREMRAQFSSPRVLAGMAVAAALLGLSGPFGTFERLAAPGRFAYWTAIVGLTYAGGFLAATYVERRWAARLPRWWRVLATGLPAGIVAGAVVIALNFAVFGIAVFSWSDIALLLVNSVLISWAVIAISVLIYGAMRARTQAVAPQMPPAPPAILERVPLPQRGRLLALSVEDHYVSIVTDRGKALVLMRLADAMRETGGVDGLQVHRSHWVARGAVSAVHKSDGKVTLELSNGLKLPVSRGFQAAIREAGLTT